MLCYLIYEHVNFRLHSYHTNFQRSGYYMMDSGELGVPNLVYCNLTKRLFDPNIEINYGPFKRSQGKEKIWFEVVKNDHNSFYSIEHQVLFSRVNINMGGAINNITKTFAAPRKGWYQFSTSGLTYRHNTYLRIKTVRNRGNTDTEKINQQKSYGSSAEQFKTAMFSRHLDIGEMVQIWEYGYKFPSNSPFTFRGYSIP